MKIFNIMMSRDLGGIQQAFIDYNDALTMQGHEVINISSMYADVNKFLDKKYHSLPNISQWCFFSKIYLYVLVMIYKPDIIICHGNRAIVFADFIKHKIKIVGVFHKRGHKYLKRCDYVIALTEKLKNDLLNAGFSREKIISIPNMVRLGAKTSPKKYREPIVIGAFGRIFPVKGFTYLIDAIGILKKNGHNIKLLIGGEGTEKESLVQKVKRLELDNEINFIGWVSDKQSFFKKIDIFCSPSLDEPFGIIVIEAMERSKPIVATKCGGPEETIRQGKDGILVEIKSSEELAEAIKNIINDPKSGYVMASNARKRIEDNYDIKIVSKKLSTELKRIKQI